ncbi:MAG: hypothetical protein ACHQ52_05600 [Candidatus Eisenbacteria bacterium]
MSRLRSARAGSASLLAAGRATVSVLATCVGRLLPVLVCVPWTARSAQAVPDATLWVVQPPGEIVAFDVGRFERIGGIRLPAEAYRDPTRLAINGVGQILAPLDERRLWLWDGRAARVLPTTSDGTTGPSRGARRIADEPRQWLLGDDGISLVVLESVATDSAEPSAGAESLIIVREMSLDQQPRDTIATWRLQHCECEIPLVTLTEPCPGPRLYAPGGVVRGSLAIVWWERDTTLWREKGTAALGRCNLSRLVRQPSGWRELTDWSNGELPLDLAANGASLLLDPDDGCCGWSNGSTDRVLYSSPETSVVVFDEWRRFRNSGYDVSFRAASARLSPDSRRVATTIVGTSAAAEEIQLSADGHADSLELGGIRRALASLPLVIVTAHSGPGGETLELPHTEVVGWVSERELIVLQGRELVAVDVVTRRMRSTGIRVRSAADAIVARR